MKKIKFNFFTLTLFLLLCSCQANEDIKLLVYKTPVIIDVDEKRLSQKEVFKHENSEYDLLYIGKFKDTVVANYNLSHFYPPLYRIVSSDKSKPTDSLKNNQLTPYIIDWSLQKEFDRPDSSKLRIYIDTTQRVKKLNLDEFNYVKSFPVIIENKHLDTLVIGLQRFSVRLIILAEAKDSTGNWKTIESPFPYGCGNGLNSIILPPNQIAVSSILDYTGEYKTTLRLKMANNTYSNEINTSINYIQFDEESTWD